jgi:nucleoside-diphosphate-sugar epimerase
MNKRRTSIEGEMKMAKENELHVVLGASGGAGNAVAMELAAQGKRVRAVMRSRQAALPASVEIVRGDALDAESMRLACAGASVVYHCVNVPYPEWEAKFPPMMRNITAAAGAANAKLIFADNLYMYGPVDGMITEDLPYHAPGHKGKLRARMANDLMEAHRAGKVRVAIGRASDFYGPNTNAYGGELLMKPLLAGKTVMRIGSLDAPHTMTFVKDFARGLILLGEREQALGQVWHIPGADPLTARQFLQLAFEAAGLPPKIGVYPAIVIRFLGLFSPLIREVNETKYQFEKLFVVSGEKFASAFGAIATPHRQAIQESVEWYRQQVN